MSDSLGSGRSTPARKARGPFPRWRRRAQEAAPNGEPDLAGVHRQLAEATAELERERARREELEARAEELTGLLEGEHRARSEAEATAATRVAAPPRPLSARQLRRRRRELERALVPRKKLRLRRLVRRRRRREHAG